MRTLFLVLLAFASLALAADREIPYANLHKVFVRAAIPPGKYFRVATRFESRDPAVATADIKLVVRSRAGEIPVPVAADGAVQFPLRDDLLKENPPVVTNVGDGKLQLNVTMAVEAPPEQRFRYELMVAMLDEMDGIISKQPFMVRVMAPDFEGLLVEFAKGTAATATVEAAKPETFTADVEGLIRIPDKKAWRKENPFVQLSGQPLRIALDTD
ncbi:MAG: DUF2987 domain-containing protein [Gammaproteobacteria bacterium]